MGGLPVFDPLKINSHTGEYQVYFQHNIAFDNFESDLLKTCHFIIDANVTKLYATKLEKVFNSGSVLIIDATENNKSLEQFPNYVAHLVNHNIRRNHKIIAIGGGIIQDITCFLAATLLRGIEWWFYPTTLLAQADSCIGSKSSVNCSGAKNILGTFTPPKHVFIFTEFLDTLNPIEVRSGIGEMLKVHAIDNASSFDCIAKDYDSLLTDQKILLHYLRRSLKIKKMIIEQDEFDQNIRNIMNYGHTFGHAIESATEYKIPHGVAVTIGMDMANYIAHQYNITEEMHFDRMHPILKKNYHHFIDHLVPIESFILAISKDKKNMGQNEIGAILLDKNAKVTRSRIENNMLFQKKCDEYLSKGRLL